MLRHLVRVHASTTRALTTFARARSRHPTAASLPLSWTRLCAWTAGRSAHRPHCAPWRPAARHVSTSSSASECDEHDAALSVLHTENSALTSALSSTESFQSSLYTELLHLQPELQLSRPEYEGGYVYFTRQLPGVALPQYCRMPIASPDLVQSSLLSSYSTGQPDGGWDWLRGKHLHDMEVILDLNTLGGINAEYVSVPLMRVSGDHKHLAYLLDTTGKEEYVAVIRDLDTGHERHDELLHRVVGLEWADRPCGCDSDGDGDGDPVLFYTVADALDRAYQVRSHVLGESVAHDEVWMEEEEQQRYVDVSRSKDREVMMLASNCKESSEVYTLEVRGLFSEEGVEPMLVAEREDGVQYHVEHHRGQLVIITNADGAVNYKMVTAPLEDPGKHNWRTLVESDQQCMIEDMDVFDSHIVSYERHRGRPRVRVLSTDVLHSPEQSPDVVEVPLPEVVGSVEPGLNAESDASSVYFSASTVVDPSRTFAFDLKEQRLDEVFAEPLTVDGSEDDFFPDDVHMFQTWATSRGGDERAKVPISVAHHKDLPVDGSNPLLLVGYGAYGASTHLSFNAQHLALLRRGWVVAIAHVRGGGELGMEWYEAGRLMRKENSFADYIASAEHMIKMGLTSPELMAGYAASAGGLLLGVAANRRPDLFRAMIMKVPFVDLLDTMLDDSLPLTQLDYGEWGRPSLDEEDAEGQAVLRYMRKYDPLSNVRAQPYPSMLVTTSTNDPRVPYHGPLEWVHAVRRQCTNPDECLTLLQTSFDTGHFGDGGRYGEAHQAALEIAFLYEAMGFMEDEDGEGDEEEEGKAEEKKSWWRGLVDSA